MTYSILCFGRLKIQDEVHLPAFFLRMTAPAAAISATTRTCHLDALLHSSRSLFAQRSAAASGPQPVRSDLSTGDL
jgi:hypothetical protein